MFTVQRSLRVILVLSFFLAGCEGDQSTSSPPPSDYMVPVLAPFAGSQTNDEGTAPSALAKESTVNKTSHDHHADLKPHHPQNPPAATRTKPVDVTSRFAEVLERAPNENTTQTTLLHPQPLNQLNARGQALKDDIIIKASSQDAFDLKLTNNLSNGVRNAITDANTAATDCTDCFEPVSGLVYHWRTQALLASVDLSLVGLDDGAENAFSDDAVTNTSGSYAFTERHGGTNRLTVTKTMTASESGNVISSADALAALKIAVGLNPNADPDGAGPREALPVSPYQYIAADVTGDGRVTSADALDILKMAVNLSSAQARRWLFVSEDYDFWDEAANDGDGAFKTTRANVGWEPGGIVFEYPESTTKNIVGILTGDVTGDWSEPAGSARLDEDHLSQWLASFGGSMTQWAISVIQDDDDGGSQTNEGDTFILDNGIVADIWGGREALSFFDEKSEYLDCTDESSNTETCDSVDWAITTDPARGPVLEVTYLNNAAHAGLVVGPSPSVDLSDYANGTLSFDIKIVTAGAANLSGGFFLKTESGSAISGELPIAGISASGEWETIHFPVSSLIASQSLNLEAITAPMVFFPAYRTGAGLVYQIDNVRFTGIADGAVPPNGGAGAGSGNTTSYQLTQFGAGNVSDTINLASYKCAVDNGNWIYNAGLVKPAIAGCNPATGVPTGTPTSLKPQLMGDALNQPVPTHKWWGSIPILGEMTIGDANDAAYITPDPIRARVSNKGVRLMGIPGGYKVIGNYPRYDGPEPFLEVFDGIAIANSLHNNLDAYLANHSEGSVTVQWKAGTTPVMEATFVHGSPYVYFNVFAGSAVLRTHAANGGQKGTFYRQNNHLGVWTDIAGVRNNFLISGEGSTSFSSIESNEITVNNSANAFTLSYLPTLDGIPSDSMSEFFAATARNIVARVDVDYSVDRSTNRVTVSHTYRDDQGAAVDTIAGLHPMHWKHSPQLTSDYQIRSSRGIIKFAATRSFSYVIHYVGVLPTLPAISQTYDPDILQALVAEFMDQGAASWINSTDTYWSGKAYGRVAELAAIADSIGMDTEATQLLNWLKAQLADWFTAETEGRLDTHKYFVYDAQWSTLLGLDEAFGSHQRLADHHFHYGYFVRAAAEICRHDASWCSKDQYGPMVELLIRDYAGDKGDSLFPHLRHFDPANGFSWADGKADALQGNNNESTSEAANAYGAIILYGLITGNDALVDKGIYLHASTSTAYWQYWNDIDGYNNSSEDSANFPPGYSKITTSILWASGADFSTWFSPAYAHILGIQGLPSNGLIFHVSLYPDYMRDYISLGLSESTNGKPSGLPVDQWRDLWWNLWAMSDANAAIADYATLGSNYAAEAGESKAHTYHWINTFAALGQIKTGTGELTSNYPAAVAFDNNGLRTYVVYNFGSQPKNIVFSDGKTFTAAPSSFTRITNN